MTLTQVLHIKDKQRSEAEAKAEARTIALCKEIPALSEIDRQLAAYGPALVGFAIAGNKEAIANLEKENLELQERRKQLLLSHGYKANEDSPAYVCAKCSDSGYAKGTLCICVKQQIALSAYASAGLGKGLIGKNFENFSLKYYTGDDLARMEKVVAICRDYVKSFTPTSQPLLFMGKTGLGKTHLSAAIAGGVAARGYNVIYETSQKLFDTYEAARFARDSAPDTEKYEECDLLLIDDLGAECGSQYTAATFFNLLNTRLMHSKPTVINTNLNRPQLEKTYGERVLSRLLGEFRVLLFTGSDVRMQKLSEK